MCSMLGHRHVAPQQRLAKSSIWRPKGVTKGPAAALRLTGLHLRLMAVLNSAILVRLDNTGDRSMKQFAERFSWRDTAVRVQTLRVAGYWLALFSVSIVLSVALHQLDVAIHFAFHR